MFKDQFVTSHVGRVYRCRFTECAFEVGATFRDAHGLLRCFGAWLHDRPCEDAPGAEFGIIDADHLDDPEFFARVINAPPSESHAELPRLDAYHPDLPPRVDLPVWRHR